MFLKYSKFAAIKSGYDDLAPNIRRKQYQSDISQLLISNSNCVEELDAYGFAYYARKNVQSRRSITHNLATVKVLNVISFCLCLLLHSRPSESTSARSTYKYEIYPSLGKCSSIPFFCTSTQYNVCHQTA